ncbi:MAG: hypothetical protein E6G11_02550 [Actinobacteria bacterium]|nr:MAG: hypothetical protein E6G11_02550 [Actinomycetota bacterium]
MTIKTKSRRTKRRVEAPAPQSAPLRRWWPYLATAAALVALAIAPVLATRHNGGSPMFSAGLPHTPDYHSLLVNPSDARRLLLGTHTGLYVSRDGGRHSRLDALSGKDAMNLSRPAGKTIWLAGHMVFKRSPDGGASWADVSPSGLPSLDIHGFAADPNDPQTLYAAVAGQGLYRSSDGGESFSLVSHDVGGAVMALAVLPGGRILAGDMQQGLLESRDRGATWTQIVRAQVMGLAVNPSDSKRIIATGGGIALSTDGGHSWRLAQALPKGGGPVAWSASDPKLAYVVGFDRTLWRSTDDGATWASVAPAKEG